MFPYNLMSQEQVGAAFGSRAVPCPDLQSVFCEACELRMVFIFLKGFRGGKKQRQQRPDCRCLRKTKVFATWLFVGVDRAELFSVPGFS